MSTYSSNYNKPYSQTGWQNLPNETTPITAEILNENDRVIEQIDNFLNGTEAFAQENKIEKILVNGTEATITDKTVSITTGGEGGDVPIATTEVAGKVKPDGTTISVAEDGTISSVGSGTEIDDITYAEYQSLTEEEKANYVGTVTGYPMQGGGSGGGTYTETVLFEDTTDNGVDSGNIDLYDDFTKYDRIGFVFEKKNYIKQESYTEVSSAVLAKTLELYEGTERIVFLDSVAYRYITVTAKSHTQFKLANSADDCAVKKVIGIKYGSGGGSASGGGISYTYEEQDTGIKWVDGRNIYQITIDNDFALTTGWTSIPNFDCTGKIPLSVETYLNGIDEYVTASAVKVSGNEVQAVFIVGSTSHSNNITTIKYLKET